MKTTSVLIAASLLVAGTSAFAAKSCEALKSEIATKLDGKKISGYSLDIVEADKAGDGKVVGSCEHGAKKIVYTRK